MSKDLWFEEVYGKRPRKPGLVGGVVTDSHVGGLGPPAPHHRQQLADQNGLSAETVQANVETAETYQMPGRAMRLGRGMVFRYRDLETGEPTAYVRFRPDHPRLGQDGEVKYLAPRGQPPRVYTSAALRRAVLRDARYPLLITEGEKKTLKAQQEGFDTIGLAGIWSGQTKRLKSDPTKKGKPRLIDDLGKINWGGRSVYIVFDSDVPEQEHGTLAEYRLARSLAALGASVKIVRLPPGPDGEKQGLDDFLLAHGENGPAELRKLIADARRSEEPERAPSKRQMLRDFVRRSMVHLTETERSVWLVLYEGAVHDKVRICQEKIAKLIGRTRGTVTAAMTGLRKKGLVIRARRGQDKGEGRGASIYFIRGLIPGLAGDDAADEQSAD
jgi:hypothetical protein